MSADKRKVSTDALETLGTIIGGSEKRDAIHLAVAPVTAGESLMPGEHITVDSGGIATSTDVGQGLGIVDPFLTKRVQKGQRFWFVMYPRTIHSLRHVWTHPAFADEQVPVTVASPSKEESEAWLRDFIARSDCPGFEEVIAKAVNNNSWSDEYLHFDGMDAHGEIPPEFWDHIEIYTGRKVPPEKRAKSFSCGC